MNELQDRVNDAIDSLVEWLVDNPGDPTYDGTLSEIADQAVPVYTYDILQCALCDISLATVEPENGAADNSPISIISANIYEYVEAELNRVWYEVEEYRRDHAWHEATYYLDVTKAGQWSIYRSSDDLPTILPNQWKAADFWSAYRLIIQDSIDWELDEIEIVWQKNSPDKAQISSKIQREAVHMTNTSRVWINTDKLA